MKKVIDKLKSKDRVQQQLVLYYLFEYGKQILADNYEVANIKEQIKENNKGKYSIFSNEYVFETLDMACELSKLSVHDLSDYIYNTVKEQKKEERGR